MQLHWHLRFSLRDYRQRTNTYRELWENKWMLLCLSLCINCYSSNYKHWMTENKVSPTIFPVYCLERVRGHGSERKKPSRIQHTPSLEQPEVIVRGDQGKRAHRTEERDTHREITPAFCKGFPLDDQHLHVKKLHKALEKNCSIWFKRTVPGAHTGPTIVPISTRWIRKTYIHRAFTEYREEFCSSSGNQLALNYISSSFT